MTVFFCEGFETVGDKTTAGATVQANITATDSGGDGGVSFDVVTGGHGGDVSIIDDFETVGFALEFPQIDAARAEYVTVEFPDGTGRFADYKVPSNASVPVFCSGARVFNADITPDFDVNIFNALSSATGASFTVRIDSGSTDITLVDNDGTTHTAASVLTPDTWHYIEVEWKQTTGGANGGYGKVYVDGVEVIDTGVVDMAGFTFFSTYGCRWGCGGSTNQTSGNQIAIDDIYVMEIDGVTHTAPLGPCRVVLLSPTSDATPNDWTPSTGANNFALIDEQDWDTTDYVDATATTNDDHYGLTTLGATDNVHGLRVDAVCIAVDGTPTLHLGFDDGTADEESKGVIGTGSTVQVFQFFESKPSGGAWSTAAVNSTEATQRMTE